MLTFVILMDRLAHIYFMSVTGKRRAIWMCMKYLKDKIMIEKNFIGLS